MTSPEVPSTPSTRRGTAPCFSPDEVNGRRRDADAWVARLDAQGDVLWQRALGGPWDEVATAVQATADGGAVVVGDAETRGNKGQEILLWKLAPDGETEWVRYLGGSDDETATDVRETDGGYFVVGSQNEAGLALRLGRDGRIDWARRSKTQGFESLALAGQGGGFAAVSHPNGLTRIDEEGTLIWQRAFLRLTIFSSRSAESDFGFLLGGSIGLWWWAAEVTHTGDAIWTSTIDPVPVLRGFGSVRAIVGGAGVAAVLLSRRCAYRILSSRSG